MAATTSNRQTRLTPPANSAVIEKGGSLPPDPVQAKIAELRVTEMAKLEIEQEARTMRQERKKVQQSFRDKQRAEVLTAAREKKQDALRVEIRNMTQKDFSKAVKRYDYVTPEMDEAIRERQGFPTPARTIQRTPADDLVSELKRRGALPTDFQPLSTTSGSPQPGEASTDPWSPEENAASGE